MISSIGATMTMVSLLQACQEGYNTVNISTMSTSLTNTDRTMMNKNAAPVHPGVQRLLEDYVNKHISYPPAAMINRVEGTVYVQFAIDDNGNLSNIATVGNRIGYGLEEEAIRVVTGMPEWISEEIKGKQSMRILPIVYKISGQKNNLRI